MKPSALSRRRSLTQLVGLLAVVGATSLLAGHEDETSESEVTLGDLAWLAGHWRSDTDGRIVEEVWLPSRGTSMIGMNRTTAGNGGPFEFLRITHKRGVIKYLAYPGGQFPPTFFSMKSLEGQVVEFENPDHDFPKLIRYERKDDTLIASIHGDDDKSMSWRWKLAAEID